MKLPIAAGALVLAGLVAYMAIVLDSPATPLEARIMPLKPSVLAETVAPSGVWESIGPDSIRMRLVVEDIHEDWATILFVWGDSPDGQLTGGSLHARARVLPDGRLLWHQAGGITYQLSADRTTLLASREPASHQLVSFLRRVPSEPALPSPSPRENL
jgi:hypothetical protein